MINQLLKTGLFFQLIIWLKPRYKTLLVAIGIIILISIAHSEYLSYAVHSDNMQYLQLSYVIKWVTIIVVLLCYLLFNKFKRIKLTTKKKTKTNKKSSQLDLVKSNDNKQDDGFDFIRNKTSLESQSDKLLKMDK